MESLSPELYESLRSIARQMMKGERIDHTLRPTALVHEAYLRLHGTKELPEDEKRFKALVAVVMRRILVDWARSKGAVKRRAIQTRISVSDLVSTSDHAVPDLIALDDALTRMEEVDARAAKVVTLRFFGGLYEEEIAEIIGVSSRSIRKEWVWAKAFLGGVLE